MFENLGSNVIEDLVVRQGTVMSLACGAAAEQGNAFYMCDKVMWLYTVYDGAWLHVTVLLVLL